MSQLDFILKPLGIKGLFVDTSVDEPDFTSYKGEECFVLPVFLSRPDTVCPSCGQHGIKYGCTHSMVRIDDWMNYPAWLKVRKQRYQCKQCCITYVTQSPLTDRGCFISNPLKHQVAKDLIEKNASLKDIGLDHRVSWTTVLRVKIRWGMALEPDLSFLPEILAIDEFRATSTRKEQPFAFSLVDGTTGKVIDILPDRKFAYLHKHFRQYPLEVRKKVRYISMDMFKPYIKMVQTLFPNAQIVIDKFHICQLLTTAMNSCRVEMMKTLSKKSWAYKNAKKHWRFVLKKHLTLNKYAVFWVPHMRTHKEVLWILNDILDGNNQMRPTYNAYQEALIYIEQHNHEKLIHLVCQRHEEIHPELKMAFRVIRRYREYVTTALQTGITNAIAEANNNKFKVLKRNAYGYRNFANYRYRILMKFSGRYDFGCKTAKKIA